MVKKQINYYGEKAVTPILQLLLWLSVLIGFSDAGLNVKKPRFGIFEAFILYW